MRLKLFGILLVGLTGAVGLRGSDFSLRLYGGWNYTNGGDFNKSIDGWREYYKDRRGEGFAALYNLGTMHGGPELGAEAVLKLSRRWSLNFSVGGVFHELAGQVFTHTWLDEDVTGSFPEPWSVEFEQKTEQRPFYSRLTVPITLGLDYAVLMGTRWTLTLGGGGGFYWGKLDLRESYNITAESVASAPAGDGAIQYIDRLRTTGEYSEELTSTGFGLHGRLGLEYRLSPSLFLTCSVLGRWVNMNGWKGSRRDASEWSWEYGLWGAYSAAGRDEENEDGQLWRHDLRDDVTGKSYPVLVFGESAPSSESRPAGINLTGLSVRIGLGFRFGGTA